MRNPFHLCGSPIGCASSHERERSKSQFGAVMCRNCTFKQIFAHSCDSLRGGEKRAHFLKFDLPHAVETVIGIVDCQDWRAGIGFGHTPIALEHDDFGPDFVVDLIPFVEHFLNVFLFVVSMLTAMR